MNNLMIEANELLKKGGFEYAFCGGQAIDLFLGYESRTHGDIDVCTFWNDRNRVIRPCSSTDMHHIRWRVDPDKPFFPKSISCPHFGTALFQIMGWNPDYMYHIRGSWAARARDEIIVFTLSNTVPAAVMEVVSDESDEVTKRRVSMCPEEWQNSFGDEFYDYALDNSFYFLAPKTDWKADSKSIAAPGMQQMEVKSEAELGSSIETIKQKVGNSDNG